MRTPHATQASDDTGHAYTPRAHAKPVKGFLIQEENLRSRGRSVDKLWRTPPTGAVERLQQADALVLFSGSL